MASVMYPQVPHSPGSSGSGGFGRRERSAMIRNFPGFVLNRSMSSSQPRRGVSMTKLIDCSRASSRSRKPTRSSRSVRECRTVSRVTSSSVSAEPSTAVNVPHGVGSES
jgi:hypothetical protein